MTNGQEVANLLGYSKARLIREISLPESGFVFTVAASTEPCPSRADLSKQGAIQLGLRKQVLSFDLNNCQPTCWAKWLS